MSHAHYPQRTVNTIHVTCSLPTTNSKYNPCHILLFHKDQTRMCEQLISYLILLVGLEVLSFNILSNDELPINFDKDVSSSSETLIIPKYVFHCTQPLRQAHRHRRKRAHTTTATGARAGTHPQPQEHARAHTHSHRRTRGHTPTATGARAGTHPQPQAHARAHTHSHRARAGTHPQPQAYARTHTARSTGARADAHSHRPARARFALVSLVLFMVLLTIIGICSGIGNYCIIK